MCSLQKNIIYRCQLGSKLSKLQWKQRLTATTFLKSLLMIIDDDYRKIYKYTRLLMQAKEHEIRRQSVPRNLRCESKLAASVSRVAQTRASACTQIERERSTYEGASKRYIVGSIT